MAHFPREYDFKSKTRCFHFDEEGRPIGRGCNYGSKCRYQHPPWPEMSSRDRPNSRERHRRRDDMDTSLRRSRSPHHRRSRSPPPRGITRGSRRDEEERRRHRDSSLPRDSNSRYDSKDYRRTDGNRSDEKYGKRGNRDDRKQDSRWDIRGDKSVEKARFDDMRKPTEESSILKSPLSASSAKEASATQSSHSRRISQAIEDSLLRSAGNSPMRASEQAASTKASDAPPGTFTLSAASETPKEILSGGLDKALQQNPLPRSIIANIGAELETRPISAEETRLINSVWDHRVGNLAKLQDLLMKKDELVHFLRDAKGVTSTEPDGPGQFQSLIERLEMQIQKADVLITDLWQELVDEELNLVQKLGLTTGTAKEHERLKNAEDSIIILEKRAGVLMEDSSVGKKGKEEPPEPLGAPPHPGRASDSSEYLSLEDLKIDELEDQLRLREAELQELEFGFGTEEFQNMVHDGLKKLKRHGRIGTVSGPALTIEEEKVIDELGVQLAAIESWAADYDSRIGERDREEALWLREYEQALNKIESASNAMANGNNLLQRAETHLEKTRLSRLSTQDAEQRARTLAEEVTVASSAQIEQHWRGLLEATRLETRGGLDRLLNDFRVFLGEVEEEERLTWQQNERKLFEEVAQKLGKTFKWQDAVVKWLEKEKKNRGLAL